MGKMPRAHPGGCSRKRSPGHPAQDRRPGGSAGRGLAVCRRAPGPVSRRTPTQPRQERTQPPCVASCTTATSSCASIRSSSEAARSCLWSSPAVMIAAVGCRGPLGAPGTVHLNRRVADSSSRVKTASVVNGGLAPAAAPKSDQEGTNVQLRYRRHPRRRLLDGPHSRNQPTRAGRTLSEAEWTQPRHMIALATGVPIDDVAVRSAGLAALKTAFLPAGRAARRPGASSARSVIGVGDLDWRLRGLGVELSVMPACTGNGERVSDGGKSTTRTSREVQVHNEAGGPRLKELAEWCSRSTRPDDWRRNIIRRYKGA